MKAKFLLLFFLVTIGCTTRREQASQHVTDSLVVPDTLAQIIVKRDSVTKDKILDALGTFMAGLSQRDSTAVNILQNEGSWHEFNA